MSTHQGVGVRGPWREGRISSRESVGFIVNGQWGGRDCGQSLEGMEGQREEIPKNPSHTLLAVQRQEDKHWDAGGPGGTPGSIWQEASLPLSLTVFLFRVGLFCHKRFCESTP